MVEFIRGYFETIKARLLSAVHNLWIPKKQSVHMHFNVERNKNNVRNILPR